ncbi:uncharacterized protein LOC127871566 isoform X2 [Dreissena polymorpha]|uniref:Ig-like domain-containing protein n=1 Tax=Dreissena polymorpha TaxID=45954 RepID=A0A9D4LJT8_DREPO|nr:uncharacterized protein LOC127871566 isoform X2 [Dreissena polymorpha]KAH3858131.1 hypothetical protein DPMN_100751 [Dreissena polymorpha]
MFIIFVLAVLWDLHVYASGQGLRKSAVFEGTVKLPACTHPCVFSEANVPLMASCRIQGILDNSNVTFHIGTNIRIQAQRMGSDGIFQARGYTVREEDHLSTIRCEVGLPGKPTSTYSKATIYITKESSTPQLISEPINGNLNIKCRTTGGRPPPELEISKVINVTQMGDEATVTSSSELMNEEMFKCCTIDRYFPSKCSGLFTMFRGDVMPFTQLMSSEKSYTLLFGITIAVSSLLCFLIVACIMVAVIYWRRKRVRQLNERVQNHELVLPRPMSTISCKIDHYDHPCEMSPDQTEFTTVYNCGKYLRPK